MIVLLINRTEYYLPLQLRSVRVPGCPNISVPAAALLVTRLPRLLQLEHDKLGAVFIHLASCHRWVPSCHNCHTTSAVNH